MISTAEAPSEICDDVPAVCSPSGSTVRRPASPSRVVSRSPWSASTTRVSPVGSPSGDSTGAVYAATSRLKRPSSTAMRAFCCEARPNSSRCSRVRPRLRAIRSAASNWLGMSIAQSSGRGSPIPAGTLAPSGIRDIASMPHAMPTSMVPAATMSWTRCADCWPEPHCASIAVAPVCWGSPAYSQARRTMSLDCSPACVTQPPTTCSTRSGSTPARRSTSAWTKPSSAAGCTPASQPLRLPSGVRTASMMTGLPMPKGWHRKLERVLVRASVSLPEPTESM